MKKILACLVALFSSICIFAQTNVTVDIDDDLYPFLTMAEQKGYCDRLPNAKPYTEKFIVECLNQIHDTIQSKEETWATKKELETVDFYISRFERKNGLDWNRLSYRHENNDEKLPISFEFNNTTQGFVSTGIYDRKDSNSTGFEFIHSFNMLGDFGKNFSYRGSAYIGLVDMPLEQMGDDYSIGYWWYDDWLVNGKSNADKSKLLPRTINSFKNNSMMPYSYKKKWDGSVYYLTNVTASGLEGWPVVPSLCFGGYGDLRGSFFDGKFQIGAARINREWSSMDNGASLVLNQNASPFMGVDASLKLFDWISFDTLTGVLEFPNCGYINSKAWYKVQSYPKEYNDDGTVKEWTTVEDPLDYVVDSMFFQNMYSITSVNIDFPYFHGDFGSTCVWPKRFDMGYMFPLVDKVIYQNSVGDFDNLGLFLNLKGIWPGHGSVWASLFLDEMNSLAPQFWKKTRCMYAWQGGVKADIPWLPFTSVTMRYTKVEPYCYTHQAIRKQPWYDGYISEAYMNNGKSLGYYLDPNSDEFFFRMESRPFAGSKFGLQYQLVRHGADFGSASVPGSSIWSELPTGNRDIYYKYFLHDGAYEWTNMITLDASYNFNRMKVPLQIYGKLGYVHDYFTQSEGGANQKTPYHQIDTEEYPAKDGFVLSIGFKAFAFDHCQ